MRTFAIFNLTLLISLITLRVNAAVTLAEAQAYWGQNAGVLAMEKPSAPTPPGITLRTSLGFTMPLSRSGVTSDRNLIEISFSYPTGELLAALPYISQIRDQMEADHARCSNAVAAAASSTARAEIPNR